MKENTLSIVKPKQAEHGALTRAKASVRQVLNVERNCVSASKDVQV